jgi:hypothetical protein
MDGCTFDDTGFQFEGAAGDTIGFLRALFQTPFRPAVEDVIGHITGGS